MRIPKNTQLQGKRSGKHFVIKGYHVTPWGHDIYHLEAEDGETRSVASFLLKAKYTILETGK